MQVFSKPFGYQHATFKMSVSMSVRQKSFIDQICNSHIILSLISATAIFAVDFKQPTGIKMGRVGTQDIVG